MRPWNPLLRYFLRRDRGEIARRAAPFAIRTDDGRRLVAQLGDAFLGGFNAMIDHGASSTLVAEGMLVPPHFRPFFFEGAAMGYLPRGFLGASPGVPRAAVTSRVSRDPRDAHDSREPRDAHAPRDPRDANDPREPSSPRDAHDPHDPRDLRDAHDPRDPRASRDSRASRASGAIDALLAMRPEFLYLYYVGIGFWIAVRHPRRPAAIEALAPDLDPFYFPLCYDGYGFKIAFFRHLKSSAALRLLQRCPPEHAPALHQGYGRALFFVFMDDPAGFAQVRESLPAERRSDLEQGRALATAFTGIDKPSKIGRFLAEANGSDALPPRLTGVTWALAARAMNDPPYFESCLSGAKPATARLLQHLPVLCEEARAASTSYLEWQQKTCDAAVRLWTESGDAVASETAKS